MSYGTPDWQGWVLNEEQSLPLLEHAYKVGLNTWDTVGFSLSFEPLQKPYLHMMISRPTSTPMVNLKKSSARL